MNLIPDELLRAHEDGDVVFFCGAGVSQSAGLPSFQALVKKVLTDLLPAPSKSPEEDTAGLAWAAYCRGDYDDALGLLESADLRTFDPREVRRRVRHHLSSPATETPVAHSALIRLTDLAQGNGRLVTTNFDRLFETAYESVLSDKGHNPVLDWHVAPSLPPARPTTFRGLLYLHGRLDSESEDNDTSLVLTKSDFGLAYMLDGWARRFVVDLFRHYHVVFVGYSVDDPTMRYLVSAMAAVRDATPTLFRRAYSFAGYPEAGRPAHRDRVVLTWRSKGIQPVLYDSAAGHAQLWDSIQAWADQHQLGLAGHRQTVRNHGQVTLTGKRDARIGEMALALTKPEIAEYFANRVDRVRPSPAWIAQLQERALLDRPKYRPDDPNSPRAPLASRQLPDFVATDDTTAHLSRWIAQCLEDRRTLDWALTQGGVLHSTLRRDVRWVLDDARSELPIALRKVWRVLASDDYAHVVSRMNATGRSSLLLCKRLDADDHFARITLLHWLRPVPVFQMREPRFLETKEDYDGDTNEWYTLDLVLEGIDHKSEISEIKQAAADWNGALAAGADELTSLLEEAMDWFNEFGKAGADYDLTHIHYRSISPHKQTDIAPIWTELIGLCRDAHDALLASEHFDAAEGLVDRWRSLQYPVFRRLALHAATSPVVRTDLGMDLLLEDLHPALWDPCTQRETLRFLRKRGADISARRLDVLLQETLRGPPREAYLDGMTDEKWNRLRDNAIRLRLQKLQESGTHLSDEVMEAFEGLPADSVTRPRHGGSHPEEFGTFVAFGWGAVSGFEDPVTVAELRELPVAEFVEWAQRHEREPWVLRTAWEELAAQDGTTAARCLDAAGKQNVWPLRLWSPLLNVLRHGGRNAEHRSVARVIGEALLQMPVPALAGVGVDASQWLKDNRELLDSGQRLQLWRRMWHAAVSSETVDNGGVADLQLALNHAGGILGEVLYAELADDVPAVPAERIPGLPDRLRSEFSLISTGDDLTCKLARVSMAIRLVELHRVDPSWTKEALLSRMGSRPEEREFEAGLWDGYFAGRQSSEDLLAAFKKELLGVLSNLRLLPERTRASAVHHFMHLAIWQERGISQDEVKAVAWAWDDTSLGEAAWAIADVLQAAHSRADVLWDQRIGPWFQHIWPKRKKDKTPSVSAALCRIAMAVDATFPTVVDQIEGLLVPELGDATLDLLSERQIAARFPEATLKLLNKVFSDSEDEISTEAARKLWKKAMEAEPSLRQRKELGRLRVLLETDSDSGTD